MIEWDLIENLHRRGLEHILDQIFGYLDYYCLRRAELVSVVWQEALLEGKIWKTLLGKNMCLFPCWKDMFVALKGMKHKSLDFQDDSAEYYRKICCLIEVELQLLESNWKKMKYSERKSEFGCISHCYSTTVYNYFYDFYDLNGDWIVRVQRDRRIVIRNRWTLEIEDVLEIPIMQIQFNDIIPVLKSVKINDSFIVASFIHHPEICVWDTKTRDLLYVIVMDSCGIQEEEQNDEDSFLHSECGLSLWKNLLLSCYTRSLDLSWILTLRCLSPSMGEEVVLLHRTVIVGPGFILGLFVDEIYTVVFFLHHKSLSEEVTVEIRNTTSFEIKTVIKFNSKNIPSGFHYANGLVVTSPGDRGKSIRIWDVVTGLCIVKIPYRESLASIRLVSNKYVVGCENSCKIKIWDLQTALKSNRSPNPGCLMKTIPPPPVPYLDMPPSLAVDEFQIVLVSQFDRRSFRLSVKNFLDAAK
ncbi:F-box/WD repeat-containing protein 11-like [Daphnia pulicaria]|uniref:F-box/WD repeat-containing protein 11-like n=1 Tax=Daphnia pulicaria TaxID=35523 RepID=UPI001EEBCDBD|nr:F-box/WD repeat-containing protein 11-like [Daphnia pulicaria]XP_046643291.1 F-box/WD repeat-containing protein 11-like [Daphnia pulicaria]